VHVGVCSALRIVEEKKTEVGNSTLRGINNSSLQIMAPSVWVRDLLILHLW